MVWEFLVLWVESKKFIMSAEASLPKIEDKKPACTEKGAKNTPNNREKARIRLNILNKVLMIVPSSPISTIFYHNCPKRYSYKIAKNRSKVNLTVENPD
jgi:hypothetical protein